MEWKAELVSCELEYLAEEISEHRVEEAAWFLLAAYSTIEEERHTLRKEVLSSKGPALMIGKVLGPSRLQRMR